MKKLFALLLAGFGLTSCNQQPSPPLATDQVNVLVGNAGYVAATGHAPTTASTDDERVQAHLAYAERRLRQQPAVGLSPALAQRRARLLDLLHRYWVAGVFPRNYDHPEGRRPCFIDRDGRLCAVGYLVAETAGRPAAERINQVHQYDLIADMRTPVLADWVKTSGLTRAECALIQPTYGTPPPTEAEVKTYAVGSAVWGGVNVMLSAANASQFNRPDAGKGAAYAGVLSGTGQLLTGALRLPNDVRGINWIGGTTYGTERTISYLNIGMGTATLALSAWNLISHRNAALRNTAVGVVNFPGPAGGSGLSLTRRF
ncbi:hypothetical protein JAO73_09875 [Hymenobacter sp. BT523]|uniref:hypothetical protein n=1 Tax=Hymenobacter sp. BT523 TaxID=2795725 RepID=UPI0018EDEAE9|nr:hypothetical protein [Hymenobacter sp. BT523]MBJ6109321.1 hypothetical protein [Hymenobacter sp. BT523]